MYKNPQEVTGALDEDSRQVLKYYAFRQLPCKATLGSMSYTVLKWKFDRS